MEVSFSDIILEHTQPSLGCTEPATIALSVATAVMAFRGETPKWLGSPEGLATWNITEPIEDVIEKVTVTVDLNTYKNTWAVGIPNANGRTGIQLVAALGLFCDANKKYRVFEDVNSNTVRNAEQLVEQGKIEVKPSTAFGHGVGIETQIRLVFGKQCREALVAIRHYHLGVILITCDDEMLFGALGSDSEDELSPQLQQIEQMSVNQLIDGAENLSQQAKDHILRGINMNVEAARIGVEKKLGLGIGAKIDTLVDKGLMQPDLFTLVKRATAGAADARMSGYAIEVMSSAGSGNQGIMAIVPIATVHEALGRRSQSEDRLIRAVALSHLVTLLITLKTSVVSSHCGCVSKAGIGAAAGLAYYLGGDMSKIRAAIKNVAANTLGEICDGAKAGCAIKLCTSAGVALQSALLAIEGVEPPQTNGIVGSSARETLENLKRISKPLSQIDAMLVEILVQKGQQTLSD